ncbi:MAG: hypothetical protein KDH97_16495 [Calditrichaeota bacterium]|nr:hypothetical protein [Calditrichota bacterium]MCB0305449.1 hypothetical protein [Calditrichota bacterium]
MKLSNVKFWKSLALMLTTALVLASGCNSTTEPDPSEEGTPPEIPPLNTFVLDFSDFDTTNSILPKVIPGDPEALLFTRQNWGWSALNVGIWNAVITLNIAVPIAAFGHSFSHDPVAEDGKWFWRYNFTALGVQHSAELSAAAIQGGIRWEMRISRQGGYQDFLWFYGESNLTATEGFWILAHNPNDPVNYLQIDWDRTSDNSVISVKYTIITPGGAENGSYIYYGINTNTPYDAFYQIYSVGANNLVEMEWNRSDKHGHIKDPHHYGNADWHCWDTFANNLQDIVCQ